MKKAWRKARSILGNYTAGEKGDERRRKKKAVESINVKVCRRGT